MSRLLAYGTLREGDYNFERIREALGEESLFKIGETRLKGYKMHNLGYYPAITPAGPESEVVCDILEASDKAMLYIDYMESSAGYRKKETEQGSFYFIPWDLSRYPAIDTGDWLIQE